MSNRASLSVKITHWKRADFNTKPIRNKVRQTSRWVAKKARSLVNRRGKVSIAGENPGRRTGALFRSIKPKQLGPFTASVAPRRTPEMRAYYPAFLVYGADRSKRGRLDPRADFIGDALRAEQARIIPALKDALDDSLKWIPDR